MPVIPLFDKPDPIQPGEMDLYRSALRNTQGNILKGHGRSFTANVFLHFHGDRDRLKTAIRVLAESVTSHIAQAQHTAEHRRDPSRETLFVGFGLTAGGYRRLGYAPGGFHSPEFAGGMARVGSPLHDAPQPTWEPAFQVTPDAMILAAHSDRRALTQAVVNLTAPFQALAHVAPEYGSKIVNTAGEPIEHFGFVDGVSQPIFFQSDIPRSANWNPGAGTSLVLAKDPFGASDNDCGTFYVFRKLAQDVAKFKAAERDLQAHLSHHSHPCVAGAFLVGRFRDGTAVVLRGSHNGTQDNDFIYKGPPGPGADPFGQRCPISAHIRKVNPRGATDDIAKERGRRIARRGITYGDPNGGREVGLLFQSCQKSLAEQFEFIQASWSDTAGNPSSTGTDPVAGLVKPAGQGWPPGWDQGGRNPLEYGGFVSLKGGAYFFLPSLTFLRTI